MAKTIVIAEDELMLGDLLALELRERGIDVRLAGDGEEAIELLDQAQPDLLLLDLLMPKKDGFTVLQHVKDKNYRFPVVVLSNFSDVRQQERCKELGAADFIVKSQMDVVDIWDQVSKHLSVAA